MTEDDRSVGSSAERSSAEPVKQARLLSASRFITRVLGWFSEPKARRLFAAAMGLFTIGVLAAFMYANRTTLMSWHWQLRLLPLLASFVAYSLALGFAILAWGQIMNSLGKPVAWREHFRVYSITNLARGLPGPLLHVAGRLMYYGKDRGTIAVVSIGSGLEILLTVLAALLVSLLTLSSERVGGVISPIWIIVVLIIGLGALHPRLASALVRRASGAGDEDSEIRLNYWQTFRWLIWYGADWIMGGLMFFALIGALTPISPRQLPYVIGAWSLAGLVSVLTSFLPVSLGIRELALSLLLMEILPSGVAVVFAILSRILLTLYVVAWASVAYLLPSRSRLSGEYSQRSIDA